MQKAQTFWVFSSFWVWLLLRKLSAYALSYKKQENLHPPPRKRAGVSMKRARVSN